MLLGHSDVKTTGIYLRSESAIAALDPRAILGGDRAPEVDAATLN